MEKNISAIHTPCKKCTFAKYEGDTQVECHLGYISKYKNIGVEVLEVYDEEKEFYLINDKKCIAYREDKWFEQYGENLDLQDKINIFKDKNRLSYNVIINLESFDVEKLDDTFRQLSEATSSPEKIVLIRYKNKGSFLGYEQIENIISKYNIKCSWRIQTMVDTAVSYDEVLEDISMSPIKSRFIVSVSEPTSKLIDVIDIANNMIHEQLKHFIVMSNKDKKCIAYSIPVYRYAMIHTNNSILKDDDNYIIV